MSYEQNIELMQACKNGNNEKILNLLEVGAQIDFRDSVGCTPLWVACWKGWEEVVQTLITNGAGVDIAKNNGATPLYIACELGKLRIVQLLVDAGADVDKPMRDGSTALYIASQHGHVEVARFLLKNGANTFNQRRGGSSPLYISSQKGHLHVVTELLHHNADCNGEMDDGSSPLYIASQFGHLNVVIELLKHRADPNKAMNDLSTPIYIASQNGFQEIVKVLWEKGADNNAQMNDGTSPLYISCQNGRAEVVRILLQQQADVELADHSRVTPLWIAAQNGHDEIVRMLVEAGASVDRARTNGDTALVRACDNGHGDVVLALVAGRADVNLPCKNGKTALHYASWRGDAKIAKFLIEERAKLDCPDACGWTPLAMASNYGKVEVVALLLHEGANPRSVGWNENTGLHLAAWNGFHPVVELFLRADPKGLWINQANIFGWTALHMASAAGHDAVVRLLLHAKAIENLPNCDGNTPLHLASEEGKDGVVDLLTSPGKEHCIHDVNHCGETALTLAMERDHEKVIQILQRRSQISRRRVPRNLNANSYNGLFSQDTGSLVSRYVRFERVMSQSASGISLREVFLLPTMYLLDDNTSSKGSHNQFEGDDDMESYLSYDSCVRRGMLVPASSADIEKEGLLFVGGSWGVLDDPNSLRGHLQIVKEFLLSLDVDVSYVWMEGCCLCPNTLANARIHKSQRTALLSALYAARYVLLIPQIDVVALPRDADRLVSFTNLLSYIESPWGALGVAGSLFAGAPCFLAFQCGQYISFQGLNRLEGCSIEVGFLRAVVFQWNHLMNERNEDFMDLVPVLSAKWLDIEEPIIQVRYVIDVGKQAQVDVGTYTRVCRLALKAADFKPGQSSLLMQELSVKIGSHPDEEDKAFMINMVLLLGYYSIGLLEDISKRSIVTPEEASENQAGLICCQEGVRSSCTIH